MTNNSNVTPLGIASSFNHIDIVRILINHDVPNRGSPNAIYLSTQEGHLEVFLCPGQNIHPEGLQSAIWKHF